MTAERRYFRIGHSGAVDWYIIGFSVWHDRAGDVAVARLQHATNPAITTTRPIDNLVPVVHADGWRVGHEVRIKDRDEVWSIIMLFASGQGKAHAVLEREGDCETHTVAALTDLELAA